MLSHFFLLHSSGARFKNRGFMIPFRIKVVEPIRFLSLKEREQKIGDAGLNVFRLKSSDVTIDLLTDSGTSAMSNAQWAAMMIGDEAYAGSTSFFKLEKTVQELMGLPFVIPTHQGRAAEQLLDFTLVKPGQMVPGNTHFDTTKAHIEFRGGRCVDCTIKEGKTPEGEHPFKGNLDIQTLETCLKKEGSEKIAYVLITMTCNSNGGQPVSLENIAAVAALCKKFKVKLFLDAARFAENAYFIQQREKGFYEKSIGEIVQRMFSFADGCTMSAKKDGLVPIGGFLALRDKILFETMKPHDILFEGFYTYGGMSGMDMEAMAQGLKEVIQKDYLEHRVGQVAYLGRRLKKGGVPVVEPFGGHAIFIDGREFYKNVPKDQFPAQLACVEIYKEGGVRGVEVGACLAGRDPDTGKNIMPALDLCRLAIPRRVYTQEHFDYVAEIVLGAHEKGKGRKTGLKFDQETPQGIRHFTSTFKYV